MFYSHYSVVQSQYLTPEYARITGYERLSKSMRLTSDECDFSDDGHKKGIKGSLGILSKAFFTFRKTSSDHEGLPETVSMVEKKQKKRSSWFPDPERRWPIQGW